MKRILVTGSRDWTDPLPVRVALVNATRTTALDWDERFVLVHGDARGLDRLAAAEARRFGWTIEPHPADWGRYGKAAGPIRNQEMVDLGADVCLAFPLPGSVGTADCMKRAEAAGIHVVVCTP